MSLAVQVEEIRTSLNLSTSIKDQEIILYGIHATKIAERFTKRFFNADINRTEFVAGKLDKEILLRGFPVTEITSLHDDPSLQFGTTTEVAASDYFSFAETGVISLKSGVFQEGFRNVKCVYKGGWYPNVEVVASASIGATMTIADSLLAKAQEFSLFITKTDAAAGDVVITGTDESGVAQVETVSMASTSDQPSNRTMSRNKWNSVTIVDSSALSGGSLGITASSVPEDLRVAIILIAVHNYQQDQNQYLDIDSRSDNAESESGYAKQIPNEAVQILDLYRIL